MGDQNNSPQSIGKVVTSEGTVIAESDSGSRALSKGSPLYQGDILVTSEGSRVEILFKDDTRLSQGESSKISLDSYVYDEDSDDKSGLLLNMVEGTFRCVTGKIVDQNPDNFLLKSPLATLGIRGTTTVSEIHGNFEKHGAEDISGGKSMVVQDSFGTVRFINSPKSIIDFTPDSPIGMPRSFTATEQSHFSTMAPLSTVDDSIETRDHGEDEEQGENEEIENIDTDDNNASNDDSDTSEETTEPESQTIKSPVINFSSKTIKPNILISDNSEDEEEDDINPDDDGVEDDSPEETNNPPNAINSEITVIEDADTVFAREINASDPDGDVLTFNIAEKPQNGEISSFTRVDNDTYSYTYTPDDGFNGSDSFTFKVEDGNGGIDTGKVEINVEPQDIEDISINVNEDAIYSGDITKFGIEDLEGDNPEFSIVSKPSHGTLTMNEDGTFRYTPEAEYHGSDSFIYKVDIDGDIDYGTVYISVNTIIDTPYEISVNEDTTYTGALPTTGIEGIEGESLSFSLQSEPVNGKITLYADGTYTYTPNENFTGNNSDTATFLVSDESGNKAKGTLSISVIPVNDAPISEDAAITVTEDTIYTGTLKGSDIDGDTLTYSLENEPYYGTVQIETDGKFTYTPDPDHDGYDDFSFTVNDGHGSTSAEAIVEVTMTPVNDAPEADNAYYKTNEDTTYSDYLPGNDVDGDTLVYEIVVSPTNGTVSINTNGYFSYTPNEDYVGKDNFSYKVSDASGKNATGEIEIGVGAVNDPPSASDITVSVNEDKAGSALLSATDSENDPITYSIITQPVNGSVSLNLDGTFTYTPQANYYGPDSFTYQASDTNGGSDTATVSITVNPINDAPEATAFSFTTDKNTDFTDTLTGTDIDGNTLTFTTKTNPEHGTVTITSTGEFTYVPVSNYYGSDSFTFEINDGQGGTDEGTVTISVDNTPNVAPTTSGLDTVTGFYTALDDTLTATDADGDPLVFSKTTDPANGTVAFDTDGTFTYQPDNNYWGKDSFTYSVSDTAANVATGTVNIKVGSTDNADTITATSTNDTIYALAGNDTIDPGLGNDKVYGEDGNDQINAGTDLTIGDTIDGGNGTDTLSFSDGAATTELSNVTGVEEIIITSQSANIVTTDSLIDPGMTLTIDGTGIFSGVMSWDGSAETDGQFILRGGYMADILEGGDGNDSILGNSGNDSLVGNDADDTLLGGVGDDTISGGIGADSIVGGSENDSLMGDTGNDVLSGDAGNDFISGGADADSITGGDGDDSIYGGDGIDTLVGNLGADTFTYTETSNFGDIITDYNDTTITDKIYLDVSNVGLFSEAYQGASSINLFNGPSTGNYLLTVVRTAAYFFVQASKAGFEAAVGAIFMNPTRTALGFGIVGTGTGRKLMVAVAKNTNASSTIESVTSQTIATIQNITGTGPSLDQIETSDILIY